MILVFGILSLVMCPPFGLAAWVMGNSDLREMGHGMMDPTGRDTTNAGRICGIIGSALMMFQVMILLVMLIFYGALFTAAFTAGGFKSDQKPAVERVDLPSPSER